MVAVNRIECEYLPLRLAVAFVLFVIGAQPASFWFIPFLLCVALFAFSAIIIIIIGELKSERKMRHIYEYVDARCSSYSRICKLEFYLKWREDIEGNARQTKTIATSPSNVHRLNELSFRTHFLSHLLFVLDKLIRFIYMTFCADV